MIPFGSRSLACRCFFDVIIRMDGVLALQCSTSELDRAMSVIYFQHRWSGVRHLFANAWSPYYSFVTISKKMYVFSRM
jgi:hypothetical protein